MLALIGAPNETGSCNKGFTESCRAAKGHLGICFLEFSMDMKLLSVYRGPYREIALLETGLLEGKAQGFVGDAY